jgi:hypothetical protein
MHGRGSIKFPNGDEYDGEFTAGALHGIGRYAACRRLDLRRRVRDGQRDGAGLLTLANGVSYRSLWVNGVETAQSLTNRDTELAGSKNRGRISDGASAESRHAQCLYRPQENADFKKQDESFASFMYDQVNGPGVDQHQARFQGDHGSLERQRCHQAGRGTLRHRSICSGVSGDRHRNEGAQSAQIARGYLDVEQSVTDLQPFLNIMSDYDSRCGGSDKFDPSYRFINSGWGGVKNAR